MRTSARLAPATLALLLLALGPLGSLGCKKNDPEADGRKVTAESTYDATEPVVHEGFRFRLDPPGPGWKLMRKEDIRRVVPEAVVGAAHTDGMFGAVIVERLPGIGLAEAEALVSGHIPNAVVESTEATTVSGFDARRTVFTATIEGVEFRYLRVLLLRDGFLHQLLAWGIAPRTPVSSLEPFIAAFSTTEGELRSEADDRPPVEHADGVTWQIRDGRFASAVSGLQLPPIDSWRYLVGQELTDTNAQAELAITSDTVSAYVVVISERYAGDDPSGLVKIIRGGLAQALSSPGVDIGTRTIGGTPVPFLRYEPQATFEYQVGVLTSDDAVTQVMAWYPKTIRATAEPAIEAVISQMTLASPSERKALLGQLLAREGITWKVAGSSAFLDDTFSDFAHQVTWTQPQGLYDVHVGDEAKATASPRAVLSLVAPLSSLYAHIEVLEGAASQTEALHDGIADTFTDRRDERVVLDGVAARRSFGTNRIDGVEFGYGVLSAAHQGNAVVMTAWGPAGSPEIDGAITGALGGLGLPAVLPDTSAAGGRFVDHHYGVSVTEPGDGWIRTDMTPAASAAGRVTQWKKGRSELVLLSMVAAHGANDDAWLASFSEQTMRDNLASTMPLGAPKSSTGTLDGHASRRLVYDHAQVEIAARGSLLTMLISSGVDEADNERFRRSLEWSH